MSGLLSKPKVPAAPPPPPPTPEVQMPLQPASTSAAVRADSRRRAAGSSLFRNRRMNNAAKLGSAGTSNTA